MIVLEVWGYFDFKGFKGILVILEVSGAFFVILEVLEYIFGHFRGLEIFWGGRGVILEV